MSEWPKTTKFYVHGDDENAYHKGVDLGLTGDALRNFKPGYEIELTLEVFEDGTSVATHINGEELVRKIEI